MNPALKVEKIHGGFHQSSKKNIPKFSDKILYLPLKYLLTHND